MNLAFTAAALIAGSLQAESDADFRDTVTQCQEWSGHFDLVLLLDQTPDQPFRDHCDGANNPVLQQWQDSLRCSMGAHHISQSDDMWVHLRFWKSEELQSQAIANQFLEQNGYTLKSRCPDDSVEILPYQHWQELRIKQAEWEESMSQISGNSAPPEYS